MKFNQAITLWFLLSMVVLALNLTNCAIQKQVEAVSNTEPAAASTPAKITLNDERHGTAADTSSLVKRLKEIFDDRQENAVFKKNSTDIEKKVFLTGERTARAEDFTKVFSAVSKAGGAPIEIPLKAKKTVLKPNPLGLFVYIGEEKSSEPIWADNGMEISFVGQMRQKENKFPLGETAILIAADKAGGYTLNGKKVLPNALKTELQNRFRGKAKDKKIIFAEIGSDSNYGFMEEIARATFDTGGAKVYFVTENSGFKEQGISFSASEAWFKYDGDEFAEKDTFTEIEFRGPDDSSLIITLSGELLEGDPSAEIKREYESLLKEKEYYKELRIAEIDGAQGIFKIDGDSGRISWQGFRKKDGKFQFVSIGLYSPDKSMHRHYEFLNILHSIKFTGN